jgi:hypothetical protein
MSNEQSPFGADKIALILHRLDQIEDKVDEVHQQALKTNGRVDELELEKAKREGRDEVWRGGKMIGMTVASGGLLALIIWFTQSAI